MPFLEYFNEHQEHELYFMYSNDRTFYPDNCGITFTKFSISPLRILKTYRVIRQDYDLIWYHGGHSVLIFFLFSFFRSKKSTFIFNVWNEWLIHKAKKPSIQSSMFRYGIRHADIIHCNWHGTAEVLKQTGWNTNIKVFYWGLQRENFVEANEVEMEETSRFIASLPQNKIKFFFPKSISINSRHDLVVEAAEKLLELGHSNFITYLWLGNTNDPVLMESLKKNIDKKGLQNHVILQSHGFLPFSDMQLIWKQMDVGLQIAANEQLSTTFLEPQYYEKEIIVTNIFPYRLYDQQFSPKIDLIPLTTEGVFNAMKSYLEGFRTDPNTLKMRRKVVEENFNMDKNLQKIIDHYQSN